MSRIPWGYAPPASDWVVVILNRVYGESVLRSLRPANLPPLLARTLRHRDSLTMTLIVLNMEHIPSPSGLPINLIQSL